MRLENDKVFNELYDEQFSNIPFIFRFSRIRFYGAMAVMGMFLASVVTFIFLFYHSGTYNEQIHVNMYNNAFAAGVLISGVLLAITALWLLASRGFEQRAFKKASHLALMINRAEEAKNNRIWSDWKTMNRQDW